MTGECAAGFWCKAGSDTPTPLVNETESHIGEPCPFGFYCVKGQYFFKLDFFMLLKSIEFSHANADLIIQIPIMKEHLS